MQRKYKLFRRLSSIVVKIETFVVCAVIFIWKKIIKPIIIWGTAEKWAAIATIIGLGVGLCQYYQNRKKKKKDLTIQYLTGFSDLLEHTDSELLDTINFYYSKHCDSIIYNKYGQMNVDTLEKLLDKNKDWRKQLDNIMNYLNQLAIGCHENFYDEHTAWYSNYYRIINASNALYPYYEIRAKDEKLSEKYDEYSKPCGYLRAMTYRWDNIIGDCIDWENTDKKESNKVQKVVQEWQKREYKK